MSRTARSILYGVTLGVLLALLLAPQSGWLVRFQALSLLRFAPLPDYGRDTDDAARTDAVAAAHPNDYQLQFAATPWTEDTLRALETRFPNSASLRANVLRRASNNPDSLFSRPEEYDLMEEKPPTPNSPSPINKSAELRAFDQDAAAGERLDPDNAYFPMMRAVGMYAAHRDAEAQSALLRAGTKRQWVEYYDDQIAGGTRLHALAFGDQSAIWHVVVRAAALFPQYRLLHSVARIATYQAMCDEQTGNIKEGVALRHALMHCGGLMRAQSKCLIGSFVGIAIAHTAMQRPGGVSWVEPNYIEDTLVPSQSLSNTYAAYLRHFGFEAEAQQTLAEASADQQAYAIAGSGDRDKAIIINDAHLHALMWCWVIGLALLIGVFLLLLLFALAAALSCLPTAREGRPVPRWALWACASDTVAVIGSGSFSALDLNRALTFLLATLTDGLFLLALAFSVLLAWRVWRQPFQWHSLGRRLVVAGLTSVGVGVIYALAYRQTEALQDFLGVLLMLLDLVGPKRIVGEETALPLTVIFVALVAPLLLIVTLSVVSRVRRVPVSAGLVFGCRAACLPLAGILLLVYSGMTIVTLHQERIVNDALTQSLQGEGAYVAAHTGQVWPGVVLSNSVRMPSRDALLDRPNRRPHRS